MIVAATLVGRIAHADPTRADPAPANPTLVDAECDPFPFATGGYGCQVGVRPAALRGVRISVASFMINVPDVIAEVNGNDGFDVRVRPSLALYVLYYLAPPGHDGFAVGGSVRYLRWRYRHDDFPGEQATTRELAPEAIVGYQWHPFHTGFYLQPWLGLSVVVARSGEPVVGTRRYDPLPVQPFFTVNIGYEHAL